MNNDICPVIIIIVFMRWFAAINRLIETQIGDMNVFTTLTVSHIAGMGLVWAGMYLQVWAWVRPPNVRQNFDIFVVYLVSLLQEFLLVISRLLQVRTFDMTQLHISVFMP